ncbi:MAG: bifunctional hydroxymethylpyrimidine kinase/phosphomethylpyrimidine kinase [Deltaproteobacteria bacterium]|jgi:hydroxymethylpyrimidine kinase/phosphomethylpyrimidine kinase|nr:bifunctional hydroxymethylpyrimidine kinase/phosphomethylpyrimidine kinase [Deltaproteobacteria bacterium]
MTTRPVALSIAGSDPTGGAGLQLDVQVFQSCGVHGAAVPTALTIQDTTKVHQVLPAFPSVVLEQLRVLVADLPPHAVKLGMLASDDVLRSVDLVVSALPPEIPLVIDPILRASDGTELLERRAWPGLIGLFPRAILVTPNRPEAAALTGLEVESRKQAEGAARCLIEELGARAVLLKGGHAEGPADDCLALGNEGRTELRWLAGERLDMGPVHGTGCALSAAITAELALGRPLDEAVDSGRRFVREAIGRSFHAGAGAHLLGLP